jgi:hypothetical protein
MSVAWHQKTVKGLVHQALLDWQALARDPTKGKQGS